MNYASGLIRFWETERRVRTMSKVVIGALITAFAAAGAATFALYQQNEEQIVDLQK